MKEPKLKTVYVCSNCGETKPPLDGPLPKLRQLEHDERGRCSGSPKAGTTAAKQAAAARPERGDRP